MQKTILIVEDEYPLLDVITDKLKQESFNIFSARSADEVFSCLEKLPEVSAVWLDHYILGKENGLDIVARMKEHDEWRHIPIFVVSNTATDAKVASYIQLGINKFYVKSEVRISDIVKEITQTLT